MAELEESMQAMSTFKMLNGGAEVLEREQLFRNMAQLFSYVSERADDEQIAQYDEVLCQLADLVDTEARAHVSKLLAPLGRAPGMVLLKLAHDVIEVARPLLEFSNVLSDDDLVEIVTTQTEEHRLAIANRTNISGRVGEAIAAFGGQESVLKLVRNHNAPLTSTTVKKLVERAVNDDELSGELRGRSDIDWSTMRGEISTVAGRVLATLGRLDRAVDKATVKRVQAVVYNRMRNRAGFSSQEWKLAYNQVKALADRRGLNDTAITRFARFGYGHHVAAGFAVQLAIAPEIFVKWLAMQDYVAMTVALRSLGVEPDVFNRAISVLPWRDMPTEADRFNIGSRFTAISKEEAGEIFENWRLNGFRKRSLIDEPAVGRA